MFALVYLSVCIFVSNSTSINVCLSVTVAVFCLTGCLTACLFVCCTSVCLVNRSVCLWAMTRSYVCLRWFVHRGLSNAVAVHLFVLKEKHAHSKTHTNRKIFEGGHASKWQRQRDRFSENVNHKGVTTKVLDSQRKGSKRKWCYLYFRALILFDDKLYARKKDRTKLRRHSLWCKKTFYINTITTNF